MPTDNKLVEDVLEFLSEMGEEMPGLKGLWSHPAAVASYLDSHMDINRVRRLLEKLQRADLVRMASEPPEARDGRRGAPRHLWQITDPGVRAIALLKAGRPVSLEAIRREHGTPIRTGTVVKKPATMRPDGVNPYDVLYSAVEDYLEFAEPDMSPEYQVLVKAAAIVRKYRDGT
jgi:hypothetical protein